MPTKQLPDRPSLDHLKHQAKDLLKAGKASKLSEAQHIIAREYGFASWPKLRQYLVLVNEYARFPHREAGQTGPVDEFLRLACLTYGNDHPSRRERARALLAEHPEIARANIYSAAAIGDVAAAREMLSQKPELARSKGGPHVWEPLLYAAYSRLNSDAPGHSTLEVARLLLRHGADPNAGYLWEGLPSPFTALTGAFGEGERGPVNQPPHQYCFELARLLLKAGADPNDNQALYNRMFSRNDDHLKLLFEFGLGKDKRGPWFKRLGVQLPGPAEMLAEQLWWAVSHNYDERVKLLVEHGADVNRPNVRRGALPPYEIALLNGNAAIAEYLLQHGAKKTSSDGIELFQVLPAGDTGRAQEILRKNPGLVRVRDERGKTPVFWAILHRDFPLAEFLLANGADVNDRWGGGWSLLHHEAKDGKAATVEFLLNHGADPNIRDNRVQPGSTPLHGAARQDRLPVARLLIQFGADVNAKTDLGQSVLDAARSSKKQKLVEFLTQHGAK